MHVEENNLVTVGTLQDLPRFEIEFLAAREKTWK